MTDRGRRLIEAARQAMERSYSPYSGFRVGAALLDDRGELHAGTNVENASFGLSICAERTAVFKAVAGGARSIVAVAVATDTDEPTPPCGACRQVLREFADGDLEIWLAGRGDAVERLSLEDLLPRAFADFPRKETP